MAHQGPAVLGIALVAMAEDLGSTMAHRALEHLLQYGEPAARCALHGVPGSEGHQSGRPWGLCGGLSKQWTCLCKLWALRALEGGALMLSAAQVRRVKVIRERLVKAALRINCAGCARSHASVSKTSCAHYCEGMK